MKTFVDIIGWLLIFYSFKMGHDSKSLSGTELEHNVLFSIIVFLVGMAVLIYNKKS